MARAPHIVHEMIAAEEIVDVLEYLRPDRIGHGILAARNAALMALLPDEDAIRATFRAFVDHGVAFTIATDDPEMMPTHLRDELELLERIGALDTDELREANARGRRRALSAAEPT